MSDNQSDRRRNIAPQGYVAPEAGWAKQAIGISGPFSGIAFGIRVGANIRAMRAAMEHAKVYGQLMEIVGETMGKVQKAEDVAREHAVRHELAGDLYGSEIERQREKGNADRHQHALADKRRTEELVKADTEILLARQTLRAKRKFEPLKHMIGEERFMTEAARRRVGAAEAALAVNEAEGSQPAKPHEAAVEPPNGKMTQAATVSALLEEVRAQLKELRADDEDSEQRGLLIADEAALERRLAALLAKT